MNSYLKTTIVLDYALTGVCAVITVFDLITALWLRFFQSCWKTCSKISTRVHFKERSAEDFMRSVFNDAYALLFSVFLYKIICCGFSFELPRPVEAIQRSTHNICYYKGVHVYKSTLFAII